jgi:heme oxygenase (biliverdin-IX-beta and delta-forming)
MTEPTDPPVLTDHDAPAAGPPRLAPLGFDTNRAPTHGERVRTLAEAVGEGTLSTLAVEPAGHPFGSVVAFILDDAGHPVFVASRLAEHTRNFRADPRASLFLLPQPPKGVDPLSLERATLLGSISPAERSLRDAYLEAHPYAKLYIDFRDMAFYRLTVEAIRYVGGFGRMSWVEAPDYLEAGADPISGNTAVEIVDHMNTDHAKALVEYCAGLYGLAGVRAARMTAVDRYGFEVLTEEAEGSRPVRFGFETPAASSHDVQMQIIGLLRKARASSGTPTSGD